MATTRSTLVVAAAIILLGSAACHSAVPDPLVVTTTVTSTPGPTPIEVTSSPAPPTSTPPTLTESYERVRSGIVRIETARCDGSGQGSGFLVAPDLVATVAHVVSDGQVVRLISGTTSVLGQVVGIDVESDVALVRSVASLDGQVLDFASDPPTVGQATATLGFTRGDPLSYKPGAVNAVGRKANIGGTVMYDLVELDSAANSGNSGGPVIDADGDVVGLLDAGPVDESQGGRFAVSAATAEPLVAGWSSAREPVAPEPCAEVVDAEGMEIVDSTVPTDVGQQMVQTLDIYFEAINDGDFPTAVAQLARPTDLESFRAGVKSSQDEVISYLPFPGDDGSPRVRTVFVSTQRAGDGPTERPDETCTVWTLEHVFVLERGLWLIDRSEAADGSERNSPC